MITTGEIDKKANLEKVRATQVQKDYVLSWILKGISKNDFLKENLVFKGGTSLKKVHFVDYRYSEDLDFTLLKDEITNEEILKNFESIFNDIYTDSRIKMNIDKESLDTHDSGSIKFFIDFKGPHGNDKIKIDITRGEKLEFDIEEKPIFKNYSDLGDEDINIQCYSLNEVLIEKMAALMGRTTPRDLYDFHYLLNNEGLSLENVNIEFTTKAKNKGHDPKVFRDKVINKENTFKRDWESSLKNQMAEGELPLFDEVWRNSNRFFREAERHLKN
ncbi:MAG: nucleotidyl transferase AbiEii/AbiGii toxin family protein [Saprospiraceae bacterium]|nr:nucleotidyl transferase AbiEii/AbiGii toxin family protein [Saprospiraceae bacterium]